MTQGKILSFVGAAVALAVTLGSGCNGPDRDDDKATGVPLTGAATTGGGDAANDTGMKLDVIAGETDQAGDEGPGDCDNVVPADATVSGTVFAPNLQIPISGALVYVTRSDAEPVPDGVYCAECVEVPCDADFVFTNPDGTFEVPARSGPGQHLIVTKGQFLRQTDLDVAQGDNAVDPTRASLPGRWAPEEGMWIPRIAVVNTLTDSIYNVLAKIGLGSVNANGALIAGTENFDHLPQPQGGALLDDIEAMRNYHIIFVPCMAQQGMGILSAQRIENIQTFVAEGGKWYVTDWANEYLYETFPDYQTLHNQPTNPDLGLYNTTGSVLDPDLLAWLEALPPGLKDIGGGHPNLLGLPQVGLVDNWSGVDATPPVITQDDEGMDVDVGHYSWVEGPCETCSPNNVRAMTISAEYGCGRMMFSTYHTDEGVHAGLTPQELILLYIILEITACHDQPPPPPPPPQG